ncbi:IS91 family transposase [bacterium AH-315-C07]|nr:IS91 family transposase [bacterium AH-315-C07]
MKAYSSPKYEVADIIGKYGQSYKESNKLQLCELKVMSAIKICRTAVLGGHIDQCDKCGHERNAYNSCRNRHCPKCQGMNQAKWVDKRTQEVLPVRHFHLVFTIPQQLNRLSLMNKKVLYGILFKAATQTITMLSSQEKHLGAKPGVIAVLHTWGQNLMEHPHIHMILTGGGLSLDGKRWVHSRKKFFLPVKVLSKVFRGKFMAFLKQAYQDKALSFHGNISELKRRSEFEKLIDCLYKKCWVVYAKKPFGNAAKVIKYLGRYTHRIAISNHRIISIDNNRVSFKYKDYRDKSIPKVMALTAVEFIRRFLLHVLPKGFFKIRYYGLLASRNKKKNLRVCRKLLNASPLEKVNDQNWQELLKRLTGFDVIKCPVCKKGQMQVLRYIEAMAFA